MTTPEQKTPSKAPTLNGTTWRDIVQSGADTLQIEGFVLEHLIDMQRDRTRQFGEGR